MKRLSVLCILILAPLYTQAALSLEVTKGIKGTVPIAVYPFIWQGQGKAVPVKLAAVITADLQNSGKFQVFTNVAAPQTVGQIDLSAWRQRKVNAVLTGEIDAQGNGQYQVHYQLKNVYKMPGQTSQSNKAVFGVDSGTVLAESQFQISGKDLRKTAHQISNQIFSDLIGEPGVFTTHLTFVNVQNLNSRLQYQLMLSDYDGYNPVMIYSSPKPLLTPAWSPDSSQIAFVAFKQGRAVVYLYTIQSKTLRVITNFAGLNSAPAFSADGGSLYLSLSKSGGVNIFKVDLQSGHMTQITHGLAISTSPTFSADGKIMYFVSTRGGNAQVYDKNLKDGVGLRLSFAGEQNLRPVSAANTLVYLQKQGDNYQEVIHKKTGDKPITAKGLVFPGTLAPDASMLVYPMMYQGQRRLILTTLSSGQQMFLPSSGNDLRYPAWSPR